MNSIIAKVLGSDEPIVMSFLKGALVGLGMGAVYYGALAIAIVGQWVPIFHLICGVTMGIGSFAEMVLAIVCFATGNYKEAAVHAVSAALFFIGSYGLLKMSGMIKIKGAKGTVGIEVKAQGSAEKNFKNGELYEDNIEVSGYTVDAIAEIIVEGDTVILKDIAVYSKNGDIPNEVGISAIYKWMQSVKNLAKEDGFSFLRIIAERALHSTSATPGHKIDKIIKLD